MPTKTDRNAPKTIRDEDLDTIIGGFNPQPDPPRERAIIAINVNPVTIAQSKGIIAI